MGKVKKWKKVLCSIVFVIVILRLGYIAFRGEIDKEYYTSTMYDLSDFTQIVCSNISVKFSIDQERLNSLEVIFDGIDENKTGFITLCILLEDELIYQTNISLATINNMEWKKVYINAELEKNQEYLLTLNASENCTKIPSVLIDRDVAPEITESYVQEKAVDGNIVVNYGYLRIPGIMDRIITISLWFWLFGAFCAVLYYFDNIYNWFDKILKYIYSRVRPDIYRTVAEIIACKIIINCCGIHFQESTKVILYVISLVSVVKYEEKKSFTDSLTDCIWKKTFLYIGYIYAAIALVGHRILIYPLTMKMTVSGLFVLGVTLFWFIPVIQTILYYIEKAWKIRFNTQIRIKNSVFFVVCACVLLIPAEYNLFANNPGISSPDTFACMVTNARHLYGMYDWHSAFYCMVLRVIETICDSTYAIIAVQHFFWAYVMLELLLYLRKRGMSESVLIAVTVFYGFNAANFIHINTIWKDIPYTLSLFWAFVILSKLFIDYEEYRYKWFIYIELIVSLVGVCLYRKNGFVSFIIISCALALSFRKNIKVLCSLLITVLIIFTIKGPIYEHFEIKDSGKHGIYIGLSQDILGVYYSGGEVSKETLQMINVMTNYNNAEYIYKPTWSMQSYDLNVEMTEFIINYIDTFLKNPVTMIRAVIAREDVMWDIYAGEDAYVGCVNYSETLDGDSRFNWNDYYPPRKYVSLYNTMSALVSYTAGTQWISAIEWRCGLITLLSFIVLIYSICKCGIGKYLITITPLVGHVMSLLLSTGWAEFRYYWVMNLVNVAWMLVMLIIIRQTIAEKADL